MILKTKVSMGTDCVIKTIENRNVSSSKQENESCGRNPEKMKSITLSGDLMVVELEITSELKAKKTQDETY